MDAEIADEELVARSREGDTDAFRVLFERKHRRVYLIAYQILGGQCSAEDVVQEVFLRFWRRCGDFDGRLPLDPWLRRIATNCAIDHWRARRAERARQRETAPGNDPDDLIDAGSAAATASLGESFDPEGRLGWRQLQRIWDELAAGLPPQQRAAFVLRHIEGAATPEVAEALGCSVSTVRSHLFEARTALRAAIRKRYPEWNIGRDPN
jgi:RNA polymerase sigma-70 factor (ECF subfamily)